MLCIAFIIFLVAKFFAPNIAYADSILQSYCLVFKINRVTQSLVHYNFVLQQSINNGSFTNLEIQHNNVVHATNCHFSTS